MGFRTERGSRAIYLTLGVALLAGAAGLLVGRGEASIDTELYKDAEAVALGQSLYGEHCAACHGANLEGEPDWQTRDADGYLPAPPHDASGHTWHHPTAQLLEITRLGTEAIVGGDYRSNMIGFADVLTDDEILAILAYIKSTWPAQILRRHDQLDAAFNEATGN